MDKVLAGRGRRWLVGALAAVLALAACSEKKKRRSYDDDDIEDEPRRRTKASASASGSAETAAVGPVRSNPTAVELQLFVMSQCPYGVQAEALVKGVADALGPDLKVVIDYVGREKDGVLTSMHGEAEVTGDIAQLCAARHAPKLLEFLECQNKNFKAVDTNWRECAEQQGLPVADIETCLNGSGGKDLLRASFNRALAKSVTGSPTMFIAGEKYAGARKHGPLMRTVCDAYTSGRPAACDNIKPAPKVNVTLLTDSRCSDCDTKKLETSLKAKLENPVLTQVDYATPPGKALFDSIKPTLLPALVFDATLDADPDAKLAFARSLREVGTARVMQSGNWNPACADSGGCALPECTASAFCRVEQPKKLELYLMSQCPFGAKAIIAMEEVLGNFKKHGTNLDFTINYIGTGEPSELKSMHGQSEVDEDLRQICAIKHYGANHKYLDYLVCRAKDYKNPDWQKCAGGTSGIDATLIKTCAEGPEGKRLLEASFAFSKASGMTASPSWFVNAKHKVSGIDAETIKNHVCKLNTLPGCNVTLSGPPPKAPPRP